MQIDCYGFEASSQWFKRRTLDPYLIKRSEGITYLCFGNQLNRPIAPPCGTPRCGGSPFGRRFPSKQLRNAEAVSSAHSRIDRDENGSVRQSWAFGRWADAESLTCSSRCRHTRQNSVGDGRGPVAFRKAGRSRNAFQTMGRS